MGSSRAVKAFVDPVLSLIRPLPSLSWIPLSILWFGIAEPQKYSIVFMGTFATLLLYVAEATNRVDPLLILVARALGANTLRVMAEVVLPGALPGILSGLKVSLAVSWTCVLSAEMVAASRGLGALIWFGKDWNNIPLIMVGMALISLTVFVVDMAVRTSGWIIPWGGTGSGSRHGAARGRAGDEDLPLRRGPAGGGVPGRGAQHRRRGADLPGGELGLR
jgi:taurine transport system permease protein